MTAPAAEPGRPARGASEDPGAEGGAPHHLVIDGRRWRATDPGIPLALKAELVHELMAARRAVRSAAGDEAAVAAARRRVQDAKVALGERGAPWWEPAPVEAVRERIASTVRTLLGHRPPEATICPSDVARVVASPSWRGSMALVREVASALAATGEVEVRQRGRAVDPATARGPLRYGRGATFSEVGRVRGGNSPTLDA